MFICLTRRKTVSKSVNVIKNPSMTRKNHALVISLSVRRVIPAFCAQPAPLVFDSLFRHVSGGNAIPKLTLILYDPGRATTVVITFFSKSTTDKLLIANECRCHIARKHHHRCSNEKHRRLGGKSTCYRILQTDFQMIRISK